MRRLAAAFLQVSLLAAPFLAICGEQARRWKAGASSRTPKPAPDTQSYFRCRTLESFPGATSSNPKLLRTRPLALFIEVCENERAHGAIEDLPPQPTSRPVPEG